MTKGIEDKMIRVTFVCLGNICRSPMAEGVFAHLVQEAGLSDRIKVDSCGTGSWHVGENPHRGTQKVLKKNAIKYTHRSRQLSHNDLAEADYLIAMDRSNKEGIERLGNTQAEVRMLLEFASDASILEVPDPYYTGGFDYVFDLVMDGCRGLLGHIRDKEGL